MASQITPKVKIQWYGKQVEATVRKGAYRGIQRASATARKMIVRKISKSARGAGSGGARSPRKGSKKAMKLWHSRPGQPPRSDTGKLKQSIFWSASRSKMLGSVGTRLAYGAHLERGTKKTRIIRPKRKKVLVFPGWVSVAGRGKAGTGARSQWGWVFAKRVQMKPLKARPYIWVTVKRHRGRLSRQIFAEIQKTMRAGGGTGTVTIAGA